MVVKFCTNTLILILLWPLVGSRAVLSKFKSGSGNGIQRETPGTFSNVQCPENLPVLNKAGGDIGEIYEKATHVFEAVVTSQSSPDANFVFGVSLRLKKCFKGNLKSPQPEHLRMNFTALASDTSCMISAIFSMDKKYIVFAKEIRNRQFWPLTTPIEKTKAFAKMLRNLSCKTCEPSIRPIGDVRTVSGTDFQLLCLVKYKPHNTSDPNFQWYWNSNLIRNSKSKRRTIKTKHFSSQRKSRSILKVTNSKIRDSGLYTCRVNVSGKVLESKAEVFVTRARKNFTSEEDELILQGMKCPFKEYCLNGGSCVYYSTLGEQTCICATGYMGKRCEQKDIYANPASRASKASKCVLGVTHYPC